jgi:alpha-1,3-glucosyltransferase
MSAREPPAGKTLSSLWTYAVMAAFALVYRAATGLHPHSGEGAPPLHGDYEAQRHWMEIARALPPRDWYRETPENNLDYWGLDYPPLSGYASAVAAWFLHKIEPEALALGTSRGYESPRSRAAMRVSVLAADLFILFPALIAFVALVYERAAMARPRAAARAVFIFVLSLPALILIDHGHFQYNGVSLGLFVASLAAMAADLHPAGAMLFCLSVYFKQMSLYYAPAVATYLLATMARMRPLSSGIAYACRIAASIIFITAIVFAPWLPRDVLHVLQRLFPVTRGLYEDKVANVWCTLSVVVKLNQLFPQKHLVVLCAIVTVCACAPFCIAVAHTPTIRQLLLSTAGCALAAYLFSYQVHEKQILIPIMPIALLAHSLPTTALWASLTASFSLFPLLDREGLQIAYVALILAHVTVADSVLSLSLPSVAERICAWSALLIAACLHLAKFLGYSVPSKPDLYVVLMTAFSCANFCLLYFVLLYHTYKSVSSPGAISTAKMHDS